MAQLFPGRIAGTVRDSQDAAVPGATVKLSNPSTGLERTAISDENGEFNFPELSLGSYCLTVSKTGFETTVITDIVTSQGAVNTVTPRLTVGGGLLGDSRQRRAAFSPDRDGFRWRPVLRTAGYISPDRKQ